jgi:CelD/BcsL family acetyltransferase involved in cellulose biosynthesis
MHVDLIDDFEAFERLRPNWEAVYAADPESQFFLTWQWLWDWLHVHQTPWLVLAAKPKPTDTEYVAFLPLKMRVGFKPGTGFYNTLGLAGDGYSDYNGVLTRPEHEAAAVPALAEHVKRRLDWAEFRFDNLAGSERRRRMLLAPFDRIRFTHQRISYLDKRANIDNGLCLSLELACDWEAYLAGLSASSRQKMRRLLRKVEEGDEHRITVSGLDTVERDIRALMHFWEIKWGERKGERLAGILERNTIMLNRCAQAGTLFMPVFWCGERPVALFASLLDRRKKSLFFLITGRDETFDELPVGYILHAYSIRYAIANGVATYDFLHGDEPYKRLFGPVRETRLGPLILRTKSGRNFSGRMDPGSVTAMLAEAVAMEEEGDLPSAELAYRQVVELAPQDPQGLYRLGRFLARQQAWAEAADVLRRCAAVTPTGDNAWLWLGRALEGLGRKDAAAEAYCKSVESQPANEAARRALIELSLPFKAPQTEPGSRPLAGLAIELLRAAGVTPGERPWELGGAGNQRRV